MLCFFEGTKNTEGFHRLYICFFHVYVKRLSIKVYMPKYEWQCDSNILHK